MEVTTLGTPHNEDELKEMKDSSNARIDRWKKRTGFSIEPKK